MIEMKRDLSRKIELDKASHDAKTNPFVTPQQSLDQRLNALRDKQNRPKKSLPWFTIISIVSCVPMFFMDGPMNPLNMMKSPDQQLEQGIDAAAASGKPASISVDIGGQKIEKTLSPEDIQAIQQMRQGQF